MSTVRLTGQFIKKHASSSDAARDTNIVRASIGKCLNGKLPRAGDFMWTYTMSPPTYTGKRKQVMCMETGQIFKSVGDAAACFNIDRIGLAAVCRRGTEQCKGYTFKYLS